MSCSTAVRPLPTLLAVVIASMTLAACGGGGGGGGGGAVEPSSISGVVVDGYMAGTSVRCRNAGSEQASTVTAANGAFAFGLAAGQSCDSIEATGGADAGVTPSDASDDILRPASVLRAPVPSGSKTVTNLFVTPASTIVHALVAGGTRMPEALDLVRTRLGLSPSVDLLGTDPASSVELYKANNAIAQILEQITGAIAAAATVTNDAGIAAIADATIDALAAALSQGTTLAQLAEAPSALVPTSPLVALIESATRNAQGRAIAASLAGVQPETLALLAAPLVASATQSVLDAATTQAVVDAAGGIHERGGAAAVIGPLVGVLGQAVGAAERQDLLNTMGAAARNAAGGATNTVTIAIGGVPVVVEVPGGASNFLRIVDDAVRLYPPAGLPTEVTLEQFESAAGVSVPRNLSKVGFRLDTSKDANQLVAPREAPLAIDIRDTGSTRVLQAIVDHVVVSKAAGPGGAAQVVVPAGATVTVYGRTASAETTSPLVITLSDTAKPIATSGNEILIDVDRLFEIIGGAAASGSPLAQLAANRVSGGTYLVTIAVGDLRIARSTSSGDPTPKLGVPVTVRLQAGSEAVTGYGVQGRVAVGG